MRPILTCLEMCPTQTTIVPTTEDVTISFLPLAHMFERVVQVRPGTPSGGGSRGGPAAEPLASSSAGGDLRCRRQGGILPGGHQTPARRHENPSAHHLSRRASAPQPRLRQGESRVSPRRSEPPAGSYSRRLPTQVQSGATTPFKKWLLNFAVDRKFAEVKDGVIRNNSLWDKLIFHKVQVALRSGKLHRKLIGSG